MRSCSGLKSVELTAVEMGLSVHLRAAAWPVPTLLKRSAAP